MEPRWTSLLFVMVFLNGACCSPVPAAESSQQNQQGTGQRYFSLARKDIQLSDLDDLEYKRWAAENKLSTHTKDMLVIEHFDSMATLKMFRPDMIDLLHLSESEKIRLLKALGKLHMSAGIPNWDVTSDSGYPEESSDSDSERSDLTLPTSLKRFSSLPTIFSGNFHPESHVSYHNKGSNLEEPSGGPATYFYNYSNDDIQSLGMFDTVREDVHNLREEELRDLLEYMVLEGITTREVQEDTLSQKSFRKKIQRLRRIMCGISEQTRRNLDRVMRQNYNASLPNISARKSSRKRPDSSDNWQISIRNPRKLKSVSWESDSISSSGSSVNAPEREVTQVKSNAPREPEVYVINVEDARTHGLVNPYFENDDGAFDLPRDPVLKFGHKGRQDGELQDATSVIRLDDSEIIVTDMVKSKLQIFDNFGAPVRTISVDDRRQPWNIALSPHGWVAVTFRGSKSFSILDKDGVEIASITDEVYKNPSGLAIDKENRYIVTDESSNQVFIHTYNPRSNRFLTEPLNPNVEFNQPRYVTISKDGDIIISDSGNNCIKIFSSDGEFLCQFGSYGQKPGELRCPYGVCADHNGNILVADHYNNRVAMFNQDGRFLRNLVTQRHGLKRPQGLHISLDRKLYITHGRMKASEILVFDLTATDASICESTHL